MRKLVIVAVLLGLAAYCLAAGMNMPANYERNVTFTEGVKVGDVIIPAGDYKVVHQMEGENHIMIFRQGKRDVARVRCSIEQLKTKAPTSEQVYTAENGQKVLKTLIFRGDTIKHNF